MICGFTVFAAQCGTHNRYLINTSQMTDSPVYVNVLAECIKILKNKACINIIEVQMSHLLKIVILISSFLGILG